MSMAFLPSPNENTRGRSLLKNTFEGATSWFAHIEKFRLNFLNSPFTICVNPWLACKQALRMGYSEICFRIARGFALSLSLW